MNDQLKNFTDLELLMLTRAIGNLRNTDLIQLLNKRGYNSGEARIDLARIDAHALYKKLSAILDERGIDYTTGMVTTQKKIEAEKSGKFKVGARVRFIKYCSEQCYKGFETTISDPRLDFFNDFDNGDKVHVFYSDGGISGAICPAEFLELIDDNLYHKHYDMIVAWAKGAEIQSQQPNDTRWISVESPNWFTRYNYRIKPTEPTELEKLIQEHKAMGETIDKLTKELAND